MGLRLGAAAAFLSGVILLGVINPDFGPEDDPWVTIGGFAIPLIVGFAIGRAWALLLAFSSLILYAFDQDTSDLAAWWAVTAFTLVLAVSLGAGIVLRRVAERLWRSNGS